MERAHCFKSMTIFVFGTSGFVLVSNALLQSYKFSVCSLNVYSFSLFLMFNSSVHLKFTLECV